MECHPTATRSGATITLSYRLKSTKKVKKVSAAIKAKSAGGTAWKPAPKWNLDQSGKPDFTAKCPTRSANDPEFVGKAVSFRLVAAVVGGSDEFAEPFDVAPPKTSIRSARSLKTL